MKKLKVSRADEKPEFTFYTTLQSKYVSYEELSKAVKKRTLILKRVDEDRVLKMRAGTNMSEDVISHFLCRMVYSQTQWASTWFVNAETNLFRAKLTNDVSGANEFFLNTVLPCMNKVDITGDALFVSARSMYDPDSKHVQNEIPQDIFVHFTKVIDLVGKRTVTLENGYVRLDDQGIRSFLVNEFRMHLEMKMCDLEDIFHKDHDERMGRLLSEVMVSTPTRQQDVSGFSLSTSERYFPLCIQDIMAKLKSNKHLKYNDRQILCLFLKDCGMSVYDSIEFFRSSFSIDKDTFSKDYLYSIRHNYGLEGKRANYTCFNCTKMSNTVNELRVSSCPFVENEAYVRQQAQVHQIDIEDVMKADTFRGKCTKFLEKLVLQRQERIITTPVKYYFEYRGEGDGKQPSG
ncbi:putative DNA primase [Ordospora colligata]|uniref:Putative DNA primase n=1 Tax=Ordospora colligata OC4 TaxID=1354746 RepID=A0A0B2UFF7_9MICR|nr:putative DNA primase [Ordospora colligata OC4]KHN69776.1 putative DNA primase [Ordospora colligata OC4]TBU15579.1 putative DNA primase [Ordospora colligata]TBU15646.1 putative DNA primase [Ordospora colligata]TBU18697.1 putative DNA primase [Ordospora colligata]